MTAKAMDDSSGPAEPARPAGDSKADHRYFRAIEDVFIRLRGAPLLLSPADWRQAQTWRRDGIPLDVVSGALEEVFRKREERSAKGSVSSLRYCRRAVEEAWAEAKELLLDAPREVEEDEPEAVVTTQDRLQALAASLPPDARWDDLRGRVVNLEGENEAVEEALQELDPEALLLAEASLSPEGIRDLEGSLEAALANLRRRLPDAAVEKAADRLRRGLLRERTGLPLLSLFAPEVESRLEAGAGTSMIED